MRIIDSILIALGSESPYVVNDLTFDLMICVQPRSDRLWLWCGIVALARLAHLLSKFPRLSALLIFLLGENLSVILLKKRCFKRSGDITKTCLPDLGRQAYQVKAGKLIAQR